jgi:hypothetical protein
LICNLNYKEPQYIPVVIHNLKNFDSNLILKELNREYFKKCKILPKTTEKFLSFTIDRVKFLDSYQFLSASLECLVNNLRSTGLYAFSITRKVIESKFGKISDEKFDKLLRKRIYPYEFMDSFDKFECTELPKRKDFYSSLNFSDISKEDYNSAKYIWEEFKCKNLGDFHNIYVLLDTVLLADVFNTFRKKTLSIYGLDPCHYFSIPTLSWNAMLKLTGVQLELINDIDMYIFIENNIKGGICQISKRYSKANNIFMEKKFDPNMDSKFLLYLDGKIL